MLCAAALLLCSCYTNYNQRVLENYRTYTGYDINFDRSEGARVMEPLLYRSGKDWYIAGVKCGVEVVHSMPPWHSAFDSWYDRNETSPVRREGQPVFYHKITPDMARRLQNARPTKFRITDAMIAESMQRAGGNWIARLPQGARPVPAARLRMPASAPHWVMIDSMRTNAPWYITTASGAVFICCDVPYSAICSAVYAVGWTLASPALLYYAIARR